MMDWFLFKTGMRYFKQRKSRALLHIWGISLGVAMIVAVAITSHSIQGAYGSLLSNIAGKANIEITGQGFGTLHHDTLEKLQTDDHVIAAAPVIRGHVSVEHQEEKRLIYILGIDPTLDEEMRTYSLNEGSLPTEQTLTITQQLAEQLNVTVGDKIDAIGTSGRFSLAIAGIISNVGIGQTNLGMFGVLHLANAEQLLQLDEQMHAIDVVTSLDVHTATEHFTSLLGDDVHVGPHQGQSGTLDQMMEGLMFLLYFSSLISIITAVFVIYNNLYAIINERRLNFAIYRSIGVRRSKLFTTMLIESLTLGVVGSVFGIIFAYSLAYMMTLDLVESVLAAFQIAIQYPVITATDITLGMAVGVGSTLLASILPTVEVLKITPTEIFRSINSSTSKKSLIRHTITLLLILIGTVGLLLVYSNPSTWIQENILNTTLIFMIILLFGLLRLIPAIILLTKTILPKILQRLFGINGRLAGDHFSRNSHRTSITLAALVTSVTFLVAISSYAGSFNHLLTNWVDNTIGWDLRVATDTNVQTSIQLPTSFSEELEQIEGVEYASSQRFAFGELTDSTAIQLSVFEINRFREYANTEVLEGPPTTDDMYNLLVTDRHVAITSVTAMKHNLSVGDSITLKTPTGLEDFPIVAVLGGYSPNIGEVYLDTSLYHSIWGDDNADAFAIRLKSGYSNEDVLNKIQAKFEKERGIVTQNHSDFKKGVLEVSSSAFQQINGLLFFAVIVAGLGVFNALQISVSERAREIGTFRAIGMRKRKVQATYGIEGLAIGIYGGIIGSLFGALLYAYIIIWNRKFEGLALELTFPTESILTAILLSIIVALIASFWPSRKAANMNIVNNLREMK